MQNYQYCVLHGLNQEWITFHLIKQGGEHVSLQTLNVAVTFHLIKQGIKHVTYHKTRYGARSL